MRYIIRRSFYIDLNDKNVDNSVKYRVIDLLDNEKVLDTFLTKKEANKFIKNRSKRKCQRNQ